MKPRQIQGPQPSADHVVAVVGMGVAVPRASSPDELWDLLCRGEDVFTTRQDRFDFDDIYDPDPAAEDKSYSRGFGYLADLRPHPALRREMERGQAPADLTALWLRHCLFQTLDTVTLGDGDRCSLAIGYAPNGSVSLDDALVLGAAAARLTSLAFPDAGAAQGLDTTRRILESRFRHACPRPGDSLPDRVGRMAMRDLLPPNTDVSMVDAACASGLYAIDVGIQALLAGEATVAFCGGGFSVTARECVMMAKSHGLSPSGRVSGLDARADGTIWGDGAAMIALKTRSRAITDGDRILGLLSGIGTSADGRAKAIYAPDALGQRLAVQRARTQAGVLARDVDWTIAHATGTPVGDSVELRTLADTAEPGHPMWVTSNKSLLGHLSWAAGAISVVHGLLALQHETIPRQQRFHEAAADVDTAVLRIPTRNVAWPAGAGNPRTAGISSFGFGGANAHLILTDSVTSRPASPATHDDDVVLVAWDAHLPGEPKPDAVSSMVWSRQWSTPSGYGASYPLPGFDVIGMPPVAARRIDRCQLMILQVLHRIVASGAPPWGGFESTTGVFVAHMGPSRTATAYALRCNLTAIRRVLEDGASGDPDLVRTPAAFQPFADQVRAAVPPAAEDSMPGMMPNCIAARASKRFDLRGPAMTLDQGIDSGLFALRHAMRKLRSGELDFAIVCGLNGNTDPEFTGMLRAEFGAGVEVAEGAFALILTRAGVAAAQGLPTLARLSTCRLDDDDDVSTMRCGVVAGRTYLGADGAIAVLRALRPGSADTLIVPAAEHAQFGVMVRPGPTARGPAPTVQRYLADYAVAAAPTTMRPVDPFPPDCLLITDLGFDAGPHATVITLQSVAGENGCSIAEITPDMAEAAISGLSRPPRHIRIVTVLADEPDLRRGTVPYPVLRLHELTFAALHRYGDGLNAPDCSFGVLLAGAAARQRPNPFAALFSGLALTLREEIAGCRVVTLFTSETGLAVGLDRLAAELVAATPTPIVVYREGQRLVPHYTKAAAPQHRPLPDAPVVFAPGGARGITAASVIAVATAYPQARIWLAGTRPLADSDGARHELEQQRRAGRARYLAAGRRTDPAASIAELSRQFDAVGQELESCRTVQRLRELLGPHQVYYLRCDITDSGQVDEAINRVINADGRIDVVLNGAGLSRRAAITAKTGADFRAVRDVRVLGHLNLRHALQAHPPHVWCEYTSVLGLVGQAGAGDYTSAAAFVAAAADYSNSVDSQRNFGIAWTWWSETGFASEASVRELTERAGALTAMSSAEGAGHLLTELTNDHSEAGLIVHLGDRERDTFLRRLPGCLDTPSAASQPAALPLFLGPPEMWSDGNAEWRLAVDLNKYPFLESHRVDGIPTLPGAFAIGLAVEAAAALTPQSLPHAVRDAVFRSRILLHRDRTTALRVLATRVVPRRVRVRVLTEVKAPDGRVLRTDVECFSAEVLTGPAPVAALGESDTPRTDGAAALDMTRAPDARVGLADPFPQLHAPQIRGNIAAAAVRLLDSGGLPARGLVPAMLIDALVRTALLRDSSDTQPVFGVPTRIGRIDLPVLNCDRVVGHSHSHITVQSNRRAAADGTCHIDTGRAVADNRVLVGIREVTMTALDHRPTPPPAAHGLGIAIVGMGLALPGANSPEELWTLLTFPRPTYRRDPGVLGLDEVSGARPDVQDRSTGTVYGALTDLSPHPTLRREIAAGTAPSCQATRWLRHSVLQSLDTVAIHPDDRCHVLVGACSSALLDLEEALVVEGASQRLGRLAFPRRPDGPAEIRRRLAQRYRRAEPEPHRYLPQAVAADAVAGLLPPDTSVTVLDTACSAAAYAVGAGVRSLLDGEADVALCGGVSSVTLAEIVLMSAARGVSTTGEVRAFDRVGAGALFSDGAAVVALKTLDRAIADGDEVLAVIAGLGTSSDGRGTVIHAPDTRGQGLAMDRAHASAGHRFTQVDWVVAHAIGIPAGDAIEFQSINDHIGNCLVTSYKSLTGHPSYASGAVGIINAILGLRHGYVPKQPMFDAPPDTYPNEPSGARIPTEDRPLPPRNGHQRVVGVNCFGFGGTNAHLVLTDYVPGAPTAARRPATDDGDEAVIVGWGAQLPGQPDHDHIAAQLREGVLTTPLSFGDPYPLPPPAKVGLPPAILRRIGRYQPLLLAALDDLAQSYGTLWEGIEADTGVLTGLVGPTDAAVDLMMRLHQPPLRGAIVSDDDADAAALNAAFERYSRDTLARVPSASEDSVIGALTNCVPARASKRLNLRGLTMTVDKGPDSTLAALGIAVRALRAQELRLALVCGVGGHSSPELATLLGHGDTTPPIAEGVFAIAVTTAHTAAAHGMDILARIRPHRPPQTTELSTIRTGPLTDRSYLGADSAISLLRALCNPAPSLLIKPHDDHHRDIAFQMLK